MWCHSIGKGWILITIFCGVVCSSELVLFDEVDQLFEVVLVQPCLPLQDQAAVTVAVEDLLDVVQVVLCALLLVVLVLVALGPARTAWARF